MAKRWTPKERTYLKRYARKRTLAQLAERFETETDEVADELDRLDLAAIDSVPRPKIQDDPHVKVFARAMTSLEKGKWAEAAKLLARVEAETDRPEVAARARQYRRLCAARLSKPQPASKADAFLVAVYERNRGHLDEALTICARGGRQGKDERFAYLAASIHALRGDVDSAARHLGVAIELNPKNLVHAYFDRDFDEVRAEPELEALLETG